MGVTTPTIVTDRLVLRALRVSEIPQACEIYGDPEVMRFIGSGDPRSPERVRELLAAREDSWRRYGFGAWGLELVATGRIIGHVYLGHLSDTPDVEMGYLISREHWGQGLAREAASAALQFAFTRTGLQRLVAVVHPQNLRSERVLQRLGMAFEKDVIVCGREMKLYSISRDAWQALQGKGT